MSQVFANLTATDLARGLRDRKWTSVELARHFIQQIDELNARTHAVVSLEREQALVEAAVSDERRAKGQSLSAIDGMPMTIKDAFRLRGSLSTYGMWMFARYRPRTDAEVLAVLRASGVVFLGRTAVPTAAFDWNCRNQIHPECINPYDASRTPGGSSGGAAAALAIGMTPLELGSDLGGSIRYPAHCCGIYGLRTTDGWLPVKDFGPESSATAFHTLVTCGPMARDLEDMRLLMDVFERKFPLPPAASPDASLRVAFSTDLLDLKTDEDTRRLLIALKRRLTAAGHRVEEIAPAVDWEALFADWGWIAGFEARAIVPRPLRIKPVFWLYGRLILERRLGRGAFLRHFKQGLYGTWRDYERALERRQKVFAELDRFFVAHDWWILPVSPSSALPLKLSGQKIPTAQGEVTYLRFLGSYTTPTTVMGTPALSCPIGRDTQGMPIGVQIHAARFSDRVLLETALRAGPLFGLNFTS